MGAAWVWGCWGVIEVWRQIRNMSGRPVRVPGSCFQYRQDVIDCGLVFPTSPHTVKYFFVHTSSIAASAKPRQKGGLQRFVTAVASSVASQLLHGGEAAPGRCPALQADALRGDEFSQVPVQRSDLEISSHSGKILPAADSPCALLMVELEGVPPKPPGEDGSERCCLLRRCTRV